MSYFSNISSEEELKKQYRRLLLQYDYRSGKNQAVIEEISKEYKKITFQLKGQAVKETAKAFSDGYKTARNEAYQKEAVEQNRINQLKNRSYTNQEIQLMLNELHKYVDTILKEVVSESKSPYRSLANTASRLDEIHLCRWFHSHLDIMTSQTIMGKYDTTREKLEYALKGRANKNSEEAVISAYEKSLGQYLHKKLMEYEDIYIDPLDIVEREQGAKKENRFDNLFIKLQMGMLGVTIAIIGIAIGAISGQGNPINILVGGLIGALIGRFIYKKSVSTVIGLNKKSLYTSGMYRKKSRVTEKKDYIKEKNATSILRFFLK